MTHPDPDIDAVSFARAELGLGRGVELDVETLTGHRRLLLVPSVCYKGTNGKQELLIVLEGKGSLLWDGRRAINSFVLMSAGFPIGVAEKVAEFVSDIMTQHCRIRRRLNAPQSATEPLRLEQRSEPQNN